MTMGKLFVIVCICHQAHSFTRSGYFYSASSSPLLLRGAPNYSIDTVSELTCLSATSELLAQGPYMVARVAFEPVTFRKQGTKPTTEPPCPYNWILP